MKKLMVAMAVAAVAIFAEAATVNWQSGTLRGAASADGGKGATAIKNLIADGTTLDMMVFLVGEGDYTAAKAMTQQQIYDAYSSKAPSETASVAKGIGNTVTVATDAEVGVNQYAVIISTYTDATYGDMFMATTATKAGSEITNPSSTYSVANVMTSGGIPTVENNWQAAAVPEPTSGLLLLLGVAGLALRRRRA